MCVYGYELLYRGLMIRGDSSFDGDRASTEVILNSFYATEKKGHIEGLYSYLWDIAAKKEILTNANRFTDYNRGAVSSKRNLKNVFDTYYLDKVTTQADGSYTVIAEAADSYSNRNNYFSRWDFYWGGAFYNPFIFEVIMLKKSSNFNHSQT